MADTRASEPGDQVYPLIFQFQDLVFGEGFSASVACYGRAVARREDGMWWIHGVQPGGVSAPGDALGDAHLAFRRTLKEILVDIASEGLAFDAFKTQVEGFFNDEDRGEHLRWDAAVAVCRDAKNVIDPAVAALPRRPAESPCSVIVRRLDIAGEERKVSFVNENVVDELALPEAA